MRSVGFHSIAVFIFPLVSSGKSTTQEERQHRFLRSNNITTDNNNVDDNPIPTTSLEYLDCFHENDGEPFYFTTNLIMEIEEEMDSNTANDMVAFPDNNHNPTTTEPMTNHYYPLPPFLMDGGDPMMNPNFFPPDNGDPQSPLVVELRNYEKRQIQRFQSFLSTIFQTAYNYISSSSGSTNGSYDCNTNNNYYLGTQIRMEEIQIHDILQILQPINAQQQQQETTTKIIQRTKVYLSILMKCKGKDCRNDNNNNRTVFDTSSKDDDPLLSEKELQVVSQTIVSMLRQQQQQKDVEATTTSNNTTTTATTTKTKCFCNVSNVSNTTSNPILRIKAPTKNDFLSILNYTIHTINDENNNNPNQTRISFFHESNEQQQQETTSSGTIPPPPFGADPTRNISIRSIIELAVGERSEDDDTNGNEYNENCYDNNFDDNNNNDSNTTSSNNDNIGSSTIDDILMDHNDTTIKEFYSILPIHILIEDRNNTDTIGSGNSFGGGEIMNPPPHSSDGRSPILAILQEVFLEVYNEYTLMQCDPYLRQIKEIEFLSPEEGQLLRTILDNNNNRKRHQLQEDEDTVQDTEYYASVVGECRNCPVTSTGSFDLYDDQFRRLQQQQQQQNRYLTFSLKQFPPFPQRPPFTNNENIVVPQPPPSPNEIVDESLLLPLEEIEEGFSSLPFFDNDNNSDNNNDDATTGVTSSSSTMTANNQCFCPIRYYNDNDIAAGPKILKEDFQTVINTKIMQLQQDKNGIFHNLNIETAMITL